MNIQPKSWSALPGAERERLLARSEQNIDEILDRAQAIVDQVREHGDDALIALARELDRVAGEFPLRVEASEFDAARRSLPDPLVEAIDYAVDNVRAVHRHQVSERIRLEEVRPGIYAGERTVPIDSVGLYVPRGRGSFPSMVYMLAVPAQLAGVPRVCLATPPDPAGRVDPAVLYAADLCGVREVYRMGGAQAVAALTFGTQTVPAVRKIVGPGSVWVAAAKRLLRDRIDVGLPAGPSESMIIADDSADAERVAFDLLIEAEHGADSQAILVSTDPGLARKVAARLPDLIAATPQPRQSFLEAVFSNYGGILIAGSIAEAAGIANEFAPEHLQLRVRDPWAALSLVSNAAEVLIGEHTAFSVANYAAGANAVLPTGGAAATWSGVSVHDFVKRQSLVHVTTPGLADIAPRVIELADYEGFHWHARALRERIDRS